MTEMKKTRAELTERGVRLSRLFDASPADVFEAFSTPAHLDQWWGPDGFRNETHTMEFKPGGEWRYTMHGPDGVDYPNRILYREIDPPHRLAFQHDAGEDDEANAMQVTIIFEEQNGQTRLTMHTIFPSAAARDKAVEEYNAIEGGQQTLEHLAEFLMTH